MAAFAFAPRFPLPTATPLFAPASSVTGRRPHTSSPDVARRAAVISSLPTTPRATLTPDSASPAPVSSPDASADPPVPAAEALAALSPADRDRVDGVRQQLEFYLSATNLRRDWYLRRQMDDEGWLDLSIFLQFNLIKRLDATLEDIALASRTSDELEVSTASPDATADALAHMRVRRSSTLPDYREWDEDEIDRSFILKNLPLDATVESLMALFNDIAPASFVRIYRATEQGQKPRALVCFEDKATADGVFESFETAAPAEAAGLVLRRRRIEAGVPLPQVVAGGHDRAYADSASLPLVARSDSVVFRLDGLSSGMSWRTLHEAVTRVFADDSGTAVRFLLYTMGEPTAHVTVSESPAIRNTLAKLTDDGFPIGDKTVAVRVLEGPEEIAAYWQFAAEKKEERRRRREERLSSAGDAGDNEEPSGVLVKLTGLPGHVTWQMIKADLVAFGTIVYINRKAGDESCVIRFGTPEAAQGVVDTLSAPDSTVLVAKSRVEAVLLQGEEEDQFWENARQASERRRKPVDDKGDGEPLE